MRILKYFCLVCLIVGSSKNLQSRASDTKKNKNSNTKIAQKKKSPHHKLKTHVAKIKYFGRAEKKQILHHLDEYYSNDTER